MNPKVTLVGAGPGDPELITLKGVKALQSADVVLYDALVCPALLDYAPQHALKIFVGKRSGHCEFAQSKINQLIVSYAFSHGHVVRLKGGDPFVFGRGFEEIGYAQDFGLETAVVPGLSSSYAVPALAGIPLTARGVSESFWVVTGTTKNHTLSADIEKAAQTTATIVILMGMKQLSSIAQTLIAAGKRDTPVAIIQDGSTPQEKIGLGRVSNMVQMAADHQLQNPAIIVVGEVAGLHPQFEAQTKSKSFVAL